MNKFFVYCLTSIIEIYCFLNYDVLLKVSISTEYSETEHRRTDTTMGKGKQKEKRHTMIYTGN